MLLKLALLAALASVWNVSHVRAEELRVPEDYRTIADAIVAAKGGDVIQLGEGVYYGSVELPRVDIAIRGAGMDLTTIVPLYDPHNSGIDNVVVWDGRAAGTPVILNGPNLSDLTISGYEGGDRDSRYSWQEPIDVRGPGGGSFRIERVRFYNHDNPHGDGSLVDNFSRLEVRDCVFEDVTFEGGALLLGDISQVEIYGCRFIRCGGYGAPLSMLRCQAAVIQNCVFMATPSMWDHSPRPTISLVGEQALIRNCSFGATGPDRTNPIGRSLQLSLSVDQAWVQNCAFDSDTPIGGAGAIFVNCVGLGLPTGNGNVLSDPGWRDAGHPGADGVWRTEDDYVGDLTPAHHSPLVDGVDGTSADLFATDANGNPRLIDAYKASNRGAGLYPYLDIGAIEFQNGQLPCLADVNHDGVLGPTDFSAWIGAFNASASECDQNGDGDCTPTDFTAWITNFNLGCD